MKLNKAYPLKEVISEVPGLIAVIGGDPSLVIKAVDPINNAESGSLSWIRGNISNQDFLARNTKASLVVCEKVFSDYHLYSNMNKCFVIVQDAKLAIIEMLNKLSQDRATGTSASAIISPHASLGKNVVVSPGAVIGNSIIGDNVYIGSYSIINDGVVIEENVLIREHIVIGGFGFNYATDMAGSHHAFPHLGGVKIEADCEIGAHSFISSGVLVNTKIDEGTKIAQFVYIGANVSIGKHCQIRARASVMGSVTIGDHVIIAPSATVRDEVVVGSNVLIGMGTLVIKSIPEGVKVYGVPAKEINENID